MMNIPVSCVRYIIFVDFNGEKGRFGCDCGKKNGVFVSCAAEFSLVSLSHVEKKWGNFLCQLQQVKRGYRDNL